MTRDLNRKISKIGYNSLNLPETITYTDGHKVMNTYDCLGRKVSVIYQVSVPSVTTLQADGAYHHYIKDYQGNNVLTIEENAAGVEGNHWDYNLHYPYGCPTRSIYSDRYMYSGKELDNMNGLRLYDFPARPYDAITTRFLSPDPLRSKYPHISPYAYCANNPILYIDPTGMFSIEVRASYNMNSGIIGERIRPRIEGLYAPFGGVIRSNSIYGSYDSDRDDAIVVGIEHSVQFLDKNSVKVEIPFLNVESFDIKEDIIGANTEEGEYKSKDKDDKTEDNLSIGVNPIYINTETGEASIDIGNMLGVLLLGFGADFSITINF